MHIEPGGVTGAKTVPVDPAALSYGKMPRTPWHGVLVTPRLHKAG